MPLAGIPDSKRRLMMTRLPKGPSWLLPASRAYHGLGIYTCCSSPDNWLECLVLFHQVSISVARLRLAPLFLDLDLSTTDIHSSWLISGILHRTSLSDNEPVCHQ